jgi:hypothetical protein
LDWDAASAKLASSTLKRLAEREMERAVGRRR